MPKQILTGTLDEQCATLYDLAKEKMAEGNYTGAVHVLKEILKHQPSFRDASDLLVEAKHRKVQQIALLCAGFIGAIVFIGLGTQFRVTNDIIYLCLAIIGAVIGYLIGYIVTGAERRKS